MRNRLVLTIVMLLASSPLWAMNELDPNLRNNEPSYEAAGKALECQKCELTFASSVNRHGDSESDKTIETEPQPMRKVDGENVPVK
jgi:hypothetical protein